METRDLKVNGFLVKPRLGVLRELLAYMAKDIELIDLNHQMYVPGKMVLGNFKERKEGFILSSGGIYYLESGEKPFLEYGELFGKGNFDIVKTLSFRLSELENIAQQARAYSTARKSITELITPLNKYF